MLNKNKWGYELEWDPVVVPKDLRGETVMRVWDRGINGGAVDLLLRETRVHRRGTYVATLRKSRGKSSLKRWSVTRKLGLDLAR